MMQQKSNLWPAAVAVSAALVLVFAAVVYGQGGNSGASSTESRSSSGRAGTGPADLNDFNQKVIQEFRANQGKVGGRYANRPLLLLTTTGAKSGRTHTT